MNKIKVELPGSGKKIFIKTNNDFAYVLEGARVVYAEYKMLLRHLQEFDGEVIFPYTGNSPIVPACYATLNPDTKFTVYERDAHDYRMMKKSLAAFKNISVKIATDIEAPKSGKVLAIVTVLNNSDRLFSFDIIEKLNDVLPDRSDVFMLIERKRQKDFMKKLQKEFFGGSVIDKCREAILYKCKTKAEANKWTAREKTVEVDAIGAKISMITRPGVFAHGRVDTGGLALYESVEINSGEKVLELGCGAGLSSLLLAEKYSDTKASFHLVDSDIRAIECTKRNIADNGLSNVTCELSDQFETEEQYDVVIGNPPYYANHRIAEYFIETAARVLADNGRLYIVSKHESKIGEMAEENDFVFEHMKRRGYDITVCKFD